MRLIGMMPVRNEDWCLGLTLRAALRWCDAIVALLHACTDDSKRIVSEVWSENPGRVWPLIDGSTEWTEMYQRQRMLACARVENTTHLAIIDADELLTGNLLQFNGFGQGAYFDRISGINPGQILQLPGYNLRGGLTRYHADGIWGRRWFSTAFCDDPRLGWSGDRFHHREPGGVQLRAYQPIAQGAGGVLHLWGASERRLRAKSALYKLTERLRWPTKPVAEIDRMYSWAIHGEPGHPNFGTPATWRYADVPASWLEPYADLMQYLDIDAEPWQESEVRRLIAENPGIERGFDLFDVA